MRVTANGNIYDLDDGASVAALLQTIGLRHDKVAVAVDGDVVPRSCWPSTPLRDGQDVEIIQVMAGGEDPVDDSLIIADRRFASRLFVGTGKYPDMETMAAAIAASGTEMVTVSVRYMDLADKGDSILDHLDLDNVQLLPNTAGATTAEQAVKMARLAREATGTPWLKLEVIGDPASLWPDVIATVEATRQLVSEGFIVLPYTSPDLVTALRLEDAGAATVMPLASPIGTGRGLVDWSSIRRIVERVQVPVVVDAGIGVPSDAAQAMELGASAVLINTAIAKAKDPVRMAKAMRAGTVAGREAFLAGRMTARDQAQPSSPSDGVVRVKVAG